MFEATMALWILATQAPPSGAFALAIEPNHSSLGFRVSIAGGMTRVVGRFNTFEARIVFAPGDPAASSVEARIDAASVDSGIDARDADLRGPLFFDAAAHPYITFVSHRIEPRTQGFAAIGELTIRGVSRPQTLPFTLTRVEWEDGRPRLGVAGRLTVDRTVFGVGTDWKHSLIPHFIANDVDCELFVWTKLGKPREAESK